MEITVLHNQSFLDVAIQHTGTASNAFKIADANLLAVSDYLIPGSTVIIPDNVMNDDSIKSYYRNNKIKPAYDSDYLNVEIKPLEGVGYWEIENNFEIE